MSIRRCSIVALITLLVAVPCRSQSGAYGSYTPYSIFGVGDLMSNSSAYNASMGGVGIASRNNRFLNYLNPAAITARDSLAFMVDFSLYQGNKIFRQGDIKSASNIMNINNCAISFPIWKKSAMVVGIRPYSSMGYGYQRIYEDQDLIGTVGNISYSAVGQGSMYEVFVGAGATFWNRLSVGVEGIYYFGNFVRNNNVTFADASYNGSKKGYELQLNASTAKFGLQYEQKLPGSSSIVAGATCKLGADLKGFVEAFEFSSGSISSDTLYYKMDTLRNTPGKVRLASELGIGIAYCHADRWRVELDYTLSDWTSSNMDTVPGFAGNATPMSGFSSFTTTKSQSFRAGFEIVPNRNDIRYYYKKIAYRAGTYYKTEYYKLDNNTVASFGITLGATLPVFRWHNGVTVGIDMGQRGSLKGNLIRERYINFSFGVNLFDIWFQKPRYE